VNEKVSLKKFGYKDNNINILKVTIETQDHKHSGALILNVEDDENIKGFYFDSSMKNDKNIILDIIQNSLGLKYPVELIQADIHPETTMGCQKTGFCVAYAIKFVDDYLLGRSFNPNDIRRFASKIEDYFGLLDSNYKDEEYGTGDILGGIAGGMLAGALLTGANPYGYGYGYPAPIYPIGYGGFGGYGGYGGYGHGGYGHGGYHGGYGGHYGHGGHSGYRGGSRRR
jgi:hypothetical protein